MSTQLYANNIFLERKKKKGNTQKYRSCVIINLIFVSYE